MNEDELRALVRQAIQRSLGMSESESVQRTAETTTAISGAQVASLSFGQYHLERAPDDTMCLIEPAVRCNHCGFCKCHGH